MKKKIILYSVSSAASLLISFLVLQKRDLFVQTTPASVMAALSDGFFVPALLFCGLGLLVWISTTGFFDIFSFGFKSLLYLFSPLRDKNERLHYYDYKMERAERRLKTPPFLLHVGIADLVICVVLYAVYYVLSR